MKSKLFMVLVVLVMLVTVVGLSGCLGGDDKNATNNTTPENNTTPGNNTTPPAPENNTPAPAPENNTPAPPPSSGGSVSVVMGDAGPESSYFIRTSEQKFVTTSLSISSGETIRIMNVESRNFRHMFHSEEGAFEDFTLDTNRAAKLTFNQSGTYRIQLLNGYTGEPFRDPVSVLTVTVS